MRNRASIRQWIGGVLSRVPAPFLVFLGGGTGALCRVHTPGGVLVANLLGSFTLGLLTMVWNAYARRDGEERIHSFRLAVAVLLVGGLVAAAAGMLTGRFVASRLVPARDVEEGR